MGRLLRIIKWGVAQGLVPVTVYQTLKCIDPLRKGRSTAPESEPVKPVADAVIDATIEHATPVVKDMVRFQRLVGCRPGELVRIKPSMVNRSGEVWTIELAEHKTAYRGKSRILYVGPRAQSVRGG
jgi:integrase